MNEETEKDPGTDSGGASNAAQSDAHTGAAADAAAPSRAPAEPASPVPAQTPAPPPPAGKAAAPLSPPASDAQREVERILADSKLPERAAFRASADAKPAAKPQGTGEAAAPTAQPRKPSAPPARAAAPKSPDDIASVHTLKDDLQTVVRDQKISFVRAAALEQQKSRRGSDTKIERSAAANAARRRTLGIITTALILVSLGVAAIAGVLYVRGERAQVGSAAFGSGSLLFAEQTAAFSMGTQPPDDLKRTIAQARHASGTTLGAIVRLVPLVPVYNAEGDVTHERPASISEFLRAIGTGHPSELERALSPEFFFGIHTVDKNAPILVMEVASYELAFAAMLEWEETMNADLAPIFTPVAAYRLDANGLPIERAFTDVVMRNYDVRALEDDNGAVQLYYSFPTRDLLIIAESPFSFTEALSRLRADRRL